MESKLYLITFYKNNQLVKSSTVVAFTDQAAYEQAEAIAIRHAAYIDEWFISIV